MRSIEFLVRRRVLTGCVVLLAITGCGSMAAEWMAALPLSPQSSESLEANPAEKRSNTVTTSFVFPQVSPPFSGYGLSGDVLASFTATPAGDGTWSISAEFRPQHLSVYYSNGP